MSGVAGGTSFWASGLASLFLQWKYLYPVCPFQLGTGVAFVHHEMGLLEDKEHSTEEEDRDYLAEDYRDGLTVLD